MLGDQHPESSTKDEAILDLAMKLSLMRITIDLKCADDAEQITEFLSANLLSVDLAVTPFRAAEYADVKLWSRLLDHRLQICRLDCLGRNEAAKGKASEQGKSPG
jgi:hypothetical protein